MVVQLILQFSQFFIWVVQLLLTLVKKYEDNVTYVEIYTWYIQFNEHLQHELNL